MNKAFLQKVLHRIFTPFMSLSGSYTLVFLIRDSFPPGYVKPLGLTLLFIAGLDIISLLAHDLFVSEKANGFTYLRYLIYLNIILALIIKFCKPIVSTGLIWAGTNFAVILTYLIKTMFDLYEKFAAHASGMDGKELAADLVENNWFVSDYVNCAKKLILALFVISLVLCAFILTLHIVGQTIATAAFISLILFIISYVGLIILYTVNDHETSFAFLGHSSIFSYRPRIISLCVLLCIVSVAAGAVLSSDTALLKPQYFMIKHQIHKVNPYMDLDVKTDNTDYDLAAELTEELGNRKDDSLISKILHKFFIVFEYLCIAAIVLGILAFLVGAFFGKKWREFWKNKKLSLFLRNVWKKLKKLIHDLLHTKRHKHIYNTVEAASFRDSMKSLLSGARKSKEKRAELDALTKKFMQLVDFAVSQGVNYKPHMAPLEFARLLADALSDADVAEQTPAASKAGTALTAGRLFEQALYAKELLTKEERALFEESVAAACR